MTPELRVWLDDDLEDRRPDAGWRQVTTAWEAISLLDKGVVVELSLDHDLGDDERWGTGHHVVEFLCEQQFVQGRLLWPRDGITLHTANAAERDQMGRSIERYAGQSVGVRRTLTRGGKPRFQFGG